MVRPRPCRAACAVPLLLLLAAHAAGAQPPTRPGADTVRPRLEAAVGERVTMRSGTAALAEFRPLLPPVDSGGECVTFPEPRPGVRMINAYFPTRAAARAMVSVTVDSVGQLLRYHERRGGIIRRGPLTEPDTTTSTSISLDLTTGRAMLRNDSGSAPARGVTAPVQAVLESEVLGRPRDRARAVQARCGLPPLRVARLAGDSLPRAVVSALYGGGPPSSLSLRVGEPSPALPAAALPPDGELLGSANVSGRQTTALLVAQSPDSARAGVEARMLAAGWTRPPAPTTASPFHGRGFVSSAEQSRAQLPGLCGPGAHLTYSATPWGDGRTLLRLFTLAHSRNVYSPCQVTEQQREMARLRGAADSILPELHPPPGVTVQQRGGGGGSDERESRAVVEQPIATAELLRHYGTQLRTAGWELVEEAPGDAVAIQLWRKPEAPGTSDGLWHATFTVSEQADGRQRNLHLRVERQVGRR